MDYVIKYHAISLMDGETILNPDDVVLKMCGGFILIDNYLLLCHNN